MSSTASTAVLFGVVDSVGVGDRLVGVAGVSGMVGTLRAEGRPVLYLFWTGSAGLEAVQGSLDAECSVEG